MAAGRPGAPYHFTCISGEGVGVILDVGADAGGVEDEASELMSEHPMTAFATTSGPHPGRHRPGASGQADQAGRATYMTSLSLSAARCSTSPASLSGTLSKELVRPMSHIHASSPKVSQSTGMFSGSYVPSG